MRELSPIEHGWITRGFFQALAELMRNHSDRTPLVAEIVRDVLQDHGLGRRHMEDVNLDAFDVRELLKVLPGERGSIIAQVNPVHVSLIELTRRLEGNRE